MKIYLVRHAQSTYNVLGVCNDDPSVDVCLTEFGIKQATALAEKFNLIQFDHIFVSELKRTQQTAAIINQSHDVLIKIDCRLNDNRTGYDGRPVALYYEALSQATDKWTVRFNSGESLQDVKVRAVDFVADIKKSNCQTVLVVTSKVIVQAIYGIVCGATNEDSLSLAVVNASCFELTLD